MELFLVVILALLWGFFCVQWFDNMPFGLCMAGFGGWCIGYFLPKLFM